MMLSISIPQGESSNNYTRILALDDYKTLSNLYNPTYYIGNDYLSTVSLPYIGYMTINKSTNTVSFSKIASIIIVGVNIYMK